MKMPITLMTKAKTLWDCSKKHKQQMQNNRKVMWKAKAPITVMTKAPSARIRIFLNPQLFLSGFKNFPVHT